MTKEDFRDLMTDALSLRETYTLKGLRRQVVMARGSLAAKLMLVGEAPGADEEEQRKPFVGRAGQLLDLALQETGFTPQVYITNALKVRPALPGADITEPQQGNRPPDLTEITHFRPLLLDEVSSLRPKVVVALGRTAANALLGGQAPLGERLNKQHLLEGSPLPEPVPLLVTHHPSAVLRSGGEQTPDFRHLVQTLRRACRFIENA